MTEWVAGRKVVVSALVGSHNYNLNTPASDKDYKFFVFPTFADLYNGVMFSDAKQTDTVDFSVHDVRQLANLIWKANINFLEVLFSKELQFDNDLVFLFGHAEKWASMNLPTFKNAVFGMHLNKMGDLHKGTEKTDKLVAEFGYDTKQATHALRCLYVLEKYADTESMAKAFWFPKGEKRDTLLKVKAGGFTEVEFHELVNHWLDTKWGELEKAYADTRAKPEVYAELNGLMFDYVKKGFGV